MAHKSRSRKSKFKSFFHHFKTVILFCVGAFFLLAGFFVLWASFVKLPDFGEFNNRKIVESTKIYDRTGDILLYDVHRDVKRTIVPVDAIPKEMKSAVIAIEDSGFYQHGPISFTGIARAILYRGTRGGGSTITQQVIKNTLLNDDKLITRKFKEILLSYKLEAAFSKDDILGFYLNEIPYGGNIYGIGEASKIFFGKEPNSLSLPEAAYLAAIPNAPTYYSPYGNHRDKLDERKNFVLKSMYDLGFITYNQYTFAQKTTVTFLPKEPTGIKAPHFVEWIKEYLVGKYGETAVKENGYKVITTLDYKLQQKAEDSISKFSQKMEVNFGAKNMALIAINPKNGQILSMVGSRDYFDIKNNGNFNASIDPNRQPGSTFKPFAYAAAFIKGYTPETVLFDLPTNFSTDCDAYGTPLSSNTKKEDCYMPVNYEGGYRGPISMRSSLAQSRNVTSVKTLYLAGIDETIAVAHKMGVTSLNDRSRYGLSLVLGGGEVSLLDMTSAYGVFANDGVRNPAASILRIEDNQGNIIEEFKNNESEVIPSEIARKINSILSDNIARTPTFGSTSALNFPNKDVAVKTGTTNDYRDVWTVGYTPTIAVGMWAGNNDNSSITKGNSAAATVSLVWHAFMEEAIKETPVENFIDPEQSDLTILPAPLQGIWQGGEKYIIDRSSGKLATSLTPVEMRGTIVVPEVHTILHWVNKDFPLVTPPTSPQNDSQYTLWETPIRDWVSKQNIQEGDRSAIPSEYDNNHTASSTPEVSLQGLDFSVSHNQDEKLTVSVTSTSTYPINNIELYLNDELIDKKTSLPYSFSFTPKEFSPLLMNNIITVIVYDSVLNRGMHSEQLIIE